MTLKLFSSKIIYLKSLPIKGLCGLFFQYISGKETIITGSCNCCGQCCRLIGLRDKHGWIRREKEFEELKKRHPNYDRFEIVSVDHLGYLQFTCSWLDEKGRCSDHKNRLDICSSYPSKMLPFNGGKLLAGCGYKIKQVYPFKKHLEKELKRIK